MAGNRKSQSASIRFAPALKALFLCFLIAGSAIGYVWQKTQILQLGKGIDQREKQLSHLHADNERMENQLSILRSPVMLDQRARQLNLGLVPAQPAQVVRLQENFSPQEKNSSRQFAARPIENSAQ
jgi:cell division protein FtsB